MPQRPVDDDRSYTDDTVGESLHPESTPVRDRPPVTIESWRIDRSGAGLRIHGRIDGKVGKLAATHVICRAGAILAFRDEDCVAGLVLT